MIQTVVESTLAADKQMLHDAVDKLKATGLTKMAPAMERGLQEVMKQVGPHRASRLIILTDGQTKGEDACVAQAMQAGQMGVPIVALGLGADWNEDLLLELAQKGAAPGYGDQIKTPNDINHIFGEMMTQMTVVAQHVALRLLLVQGVEARRVWQVTPLIKDISYGAVQGRTVSVHLPELSESGAAYLIEMIIPPRQNGRYRFAQAEVSYTMPNVGEQKERRDMTLEVSPTAYADQQVDRHIMDTVERVTAFKLQT
ncbi:MAG: VWA domain-containing protein [Chloroflexota bacterium]